MKMSSVRSWFATSSTKSVTDRSPWFPTETKRETRDSVLDELRKTDAILLGAVGSPEVPPGVLARGLLLRLRAELDLYVNLRPSKLRPGVAGAVARHPAADLDFVIVRENTEGLYAGAGGTVHRGTAFESATGTTVGGAQLIAGKTNPVIAGDKSLYIAPGAPGSTKLSVSQLMVRLAVSPGDTE